MEKRRARRHARRLRVRFGVRGEAGFPWDGFTHDVSASGLFVVTGHQVAPGGRVHLEVLLPGAGALYAEGLVSRQALVPPELRAVVRGGLGVRLLGAHELLGELVPSQAPPRAGRGERFCLAFTDREQLKTAYEQHFRRGAAYVVTEGAVPEQTLVTLTFDVRFVQRQLAVEGRVVGRETFPDGRTLHTVAFTDPVATLAALGATLEA